MIGKLYQEALLDLEEIKKVVEEDAKKKIYDQLTPRIKSLIEKKLFEEEVSEDDSNGNLITDESDDIDEEEDLEEEDLNELTNLQQIVADTGGADVPAQSTSEFPSERNSSLFELKNICASIITETQNLSSKRPSYRQLKETLKKIDTARKLVVKNGGKLNENMINSYVNILENCFNKLTGNKVLSEVDIVLKGLDEKLLTSGDVVYEVDFSDPYEKFNSHLEDDDIDLDLVDVDHEDHETIRSRRFGQHNLESYEEDEFDSDDEFDSGEDDDLDDYEEIEIVEFDNNHNKLKNENFGRTTMRRRNLNESVHERMMAELKAEMEMEEDNLEEDLYEIDESTEMEEDEMMEVDEEDLQEALEELELDEDEEMEEGYHEGDLEEDELEEMMLEVSLDEDEEAEEEEKEVEEEEKEVEEEMKIDFATMSDEELEKFKSDVESELNSRTEDDDNSDVDDDDGEEGDAAPEPEEASDEVDEMDEGKLQLESKFNRYKKLYMESKSGSKQEAQYLNILKEIATKLSRKNTLSERSQNRRSTTNVSSAERKLKNKLEESNLLNAKLLYTNKLLQNPSLTNRQKAKLVEKIDESRSLREVKLVFESVQRLTSESSRLTENRSRVLGSSSMSTAGSSSSAGLVTESFEAQRWAKLAGIK